MISSRRAREAKTKECSMDDTLCTLCSEGISILGRHYMKLVTLSDHFYSEYSGCKEILKKKDRPYYCISLNVDGHEYAIPLRHHIKHAYAFYTVREAGLDYTKAVLIDDSSYVSSDSPWIDTTEWNIIRGNEDKIFSGFSRYIRQFKRALAHKDNPRSQNILKYSALQYFEI